MWVEVALLALFIGFLYFLKDVIKKILKSY